MSGVTPHEASACMSDQVFIGNRYIFVVKFLFFPHCLLLFRSNLDLYPSVKTKVMELNLLRLRLAVCLGLFIQLANGFSESLKCVG